jgi:hypothetical protein
MTAMLRARPVSIVESTYTPVSGRELPPRIRLRHGELEFFLKLTIADCNRPRRELAGTR